LKKQPDTLSFLKFSILPYKVYFLALLQEAADYEIGTQEKTPLAKTVRTARQLLQVEPAMWLVVTVEGVEPTNNAAERAIRPAVLWPRPVLGLKALPEVILWRGCLQ
jgi:hypothetical protein